MSSDVTQTAVILGAGFSKCAGLPLTHELAEHLLTPEFDDDAIDQAITSAIKEFLAYAFNWRTGQSMPGLEEVFTLIDLSANSGHHLGRQFPPRRLRALRRMLIYRVFSILDRKYRSSAEIRGFLQTLLPTEGEPQTAFIVLNWDIVLERHLDEFPGVGIDYCAKVEPWGGSGQNDIRTVPVAKVHGSSNWVYCDNCRTLFYDRTRKLSHAIRAGLIKSDFRLFDERFAKRTFRGSLGVPAAERACRHCGIAVGPHIATFSYRKSFRTHVSAATWSAADRLLSAAARWVFIGYSLPAADYEFKHLLKTAELKQKRGKVAAKDIHVVLLNNCVAAEQFRTFFGPAAITVHQGGLAGFLPPNDGLHSAVGGGIPGVGRRDSGSSAKRRN